MTDHTDRLADARLYLCTDAREKQGDLEQFLDAALAGGVDIVQLRQKEMEAADELAALEVFADACKRHGKLLAVNDRADIAFASRADVLHLGQRDLPVHAARAVTGPDPIIGRSTHTFSQVNAVVAEEGSDYFCVGPTWETPTKPGRQAAGLDLVSYAASRPQSKPWFAIGGIDLDRLDQVIEAGATRVVVVRAITEADDPQAAAAEFSRRLRGAG
ncbi:thiamine phosphate synthase [Kribbella capetownensis]|uniref:Thiamine-phosphate synthase n=1 Tax=Kribbella capetownensis TaxID=1572659 RepID=A0A4R0JT63_9ACTN|nr:thiamine phosphate synthase [Kribbella capetownensis]TCC50119.1 thiamine phosphate synthase [Kribbella capetownensis]